ncbi:MAG TPA: Rieske 2Fe-2S domain-containing protein [Actinomycetota bacterium]|nr:Rieske 2Fe-2S domain-containing protein [Actinomycetota bacterium]
MRPIPRELLTDQIERLDALDGLAERVQKVVGQFVPEGTRIKDVLSGTWLGHPIHPVLTDLVVGAWTSAAILDLVGGDRTAKASDRLVGVGVLSAVPTAAAGLSDWADLWGAQRRIGMVHATGNSTALALYTLSWLARKSKKRGLGVALSTLGYGAALLSAYLGGSLTYSKGIGVNQTAFEESPTDWTAVYDEAQLPEGAPVMGRAGKVDILLYKRDGRINAILDKCAHRGCALHDGRINDGVTVTCPCHGSTYRLDDGSVVQGPATSDQQPFEVRVRDGKLEVRKRAEAG